MARSAAAITARAVLGGAGKCRRAAFASGWHRLRRVCRHLQSRLRYARARRPCRDVVALDDWQHAQHCRQPSFLRFRSARPVARRRYSLLVLPGRVASRLPCPADWRGQHCARRRGQFVVAPLSLCRFHQGLDAVSRWALQGLRCFWQWLCARRGWGGAPPQAAGTGNRRWRRYQGGNPCNGCQC